MLLRLECFLPFFASRSFPFLVDLIYSSGSLFSVLSHNCRRALGGIGHCDARFSKVGQRTYVRIQHQPKFTGNIWHVPLNQWLCVEQTGLR